MLILQVIVVWSANRNLCDGWCYIAVTLTDQLSKREIALLSTIIAKRRSTVDEFAEITLKEAGVAVRPRLFDDRASELGCSSAADIRDKAVQLL
jgi:hypothetical protein